MNELPTGWATGRLGQIAEINPPQPNTPVHDHDVVSFIPMAKVQAESGLIETPDLRTWGEVKKGFTRFQDGDILFAKITPCMENGKIAIAKELRGGVGAGSTEFHVLRPPRGLEAKYIFYYLLQRDVRRDARMEMKGAAGQLRVPTSFLEQFELPVAPVLEQTRIVAEIEKQLTRLDAATAALKRVQANLKRYRAAVLKAACEGRLVPTEAELARKEGRDYEPASELLKRILRERRARWEADTLAKMIASGKPPKDDRWKQKYKEPGTLDANGLHNLPAGWIRVRLDVVAEVIDPNPSHRTPKYVADGPAFVSAENFVGESSVDFSIGRRVSAEVLAEQINRFQIRPGAFVMSRYGTIGATCKIPVERTFCLSYSLVLIQATCEAVDSNFLRIVCSSSLIRDIAVSKVQGATIPDLGVAHIRSFPIAIPPLSEQRRIVEEVERRISMVDRVSETVQDQFVHSAKVRSGILHSGFSGRLVPQDPSDEPASVLLERIRAERAATIKAKPSGRTRKELALV